VPLGDVKLDLRPREADGGEVVGGVGVAHRAVVAVGDAGARDVGPGADVVDLVLPGAHDGVVHGRDGLAGARRDGEPVDGDVRARAVRVVRAGVADLQGVRAGGQRRAGVDQDVARVVGRVHVDVGFRAVVDGDRGNAAVVPLGGVELDPRPGEVDGGGIV